MSIGKVFMMQIKRSVAAVAATAALLGISACGGAESDTATATSTAVPTTSEAVPSAEAQAHNNADVMFAQGMVPHHEQAVEMSDMVLGKQGIDPRVVSLAEDIKAAQGPEIAQMQSWLTEWGSPAGTMPGSGMPGMPGHDMPGHGMMPGMGGHGMMTAQDMAALQNAQGVAASRLFLTQMITHHQGAVLMAQNEIDAGKYPPALDMARSIVTSQQAEIATMEKLLQDI
ncbi:DUF305 domain-containing protein [soil metagenome]